MKTQLLRAMRAEAIAHAAFFGRGNDSEAIAARFAVSRANVSLGYFEHLTGYLETNEPLCPEGKAAHEACTCALHGIATDHDLD
jgi:hypothetical protein